MKLFSLMALLCTTSIVWSQSGTPTANFAVSTNNICMGECIEIINTTTSNAQSWSWDFGVGATPSSYQGQNPGPVCFPNPGTYTIVLTATNTFGSNSSSQTINVTATPSVNGTVSDTTGGVFVELTDTTIFMYQEAYLWAEGTPAGGTMTWFPSGVESDQISVNNGDSLTVTPFYTTLYVVSYSVNGCFAYDTVLVNVRFNDSIKVAVPNSFSPNGDGINDYLRILTNVDEDNNFTNGFKEGGAVAEIDFKVYNSYGILVFRTTDPHEGWDGTYKGKKENPATFIYVVDYKLINGISQSLKGNVTLYR
jgi:gliding motility-associated-like protein